LNSIGVFAVSLGAFYTYFCSCGELECHAGQVGQPGIL
jgi:hypothetical protein